MGYTQELMRLLKPLGVYTFRDGSLSMAQVTALGTQLDAALTQLTTNQRESIASTAQSTGLAQFEALFPYRSAAQTVAARRAAVAGFLQVSGDGFTLAALRRCLAACGVSCLLEENGVNRLRISFPGVMGIPEDIARIMLITEELLPAQAEIVYAYRWCTWAETAQYGFTWQTLAQKTWQQWRVYTE